MQIRFLSILFLTCISLGACAQEKASSASRLSADARKAYAAAGSADDAADHRPHAGMLRFPDISATHIVFVYANDIWLLPREGGVATPLASPPGVELFPRFSPNGQTIAFAGHYDGNRDLYTIGIAGGTPLRVTHHPSGETLCDWTPDGDLIFFTSGLAGLRRMSQLFTVPAAGGLAKRLPVPYGANGAVSPDGHWLAYTPHTRDHRTWKRYRGGMATDIWLFHLTDHTSKKMTDWEGTDSQPMWHGSTVYYLSDAGPAHKLNIWAYDTKSGTRQQVTFEKEYDLKWPAIGPGPSGGGEIVFQNGPALQRLDLAGRKVRTVEVIIPGARPKIRPKRVDVSKNLFSYDISSTGKRGVLEVRGDLWTVPAKDGSPRNLTRTGGTAERDPSWSPDGQWIAYFSDASGEYELTITQSDGKGETRQLTTGGMVFRYMPIWSPDSNMIAFSDKTGAMYVHTIETGDTKLIDTEPFGGPTPMSWSHDSGWLAYAKSGENRQAAIWLYHVEPGERRQVTSGMFNDRSPTFDREGKYLFYASNREFNSPMYEDVGQAFVYANTDRLYAVPLRDEVGSPYAPKTDEEKWGDEKDDDEEEDDEDEDDEDDDSDDDSKNGDGDGADADGDDNDKDDDEEESKIEPLVIELDGFERRAILLPMDRGNFGNLAVNHKNKLIYVRRSPRGSDTEPAIILFDLDDEEKEEKTVLEGVSVFALSANGKKLIVRKDDKMAIIDAKPDQDFDKPMSLKGMTTLIDPREEWHQLLLEAWRLQRDFFYDPNMHGVDWEVMLVRYGAMLRDCASREDVTFVIGELISELNVGHAYARGGGDVEETPTSNVGLLGADFELRDGGYIISRIYEGAAWDADARGPLSQPGVDVKQGDYLLAVNGVPLDTSKDPWAAFQGMAGQVVTLTVHDKPQADEDSREVVVKLLDSEVRLRYRAWIERNRAYVARKSDGRVGYIYVPNTGVSGQNDLFRQFYGQRHKDALIIDERWNGGGQIPTRFIELLNRPVTNYWATRDGLDWSWPPDAHFGPKCMLINGLAGSGGDCFPYYFRSSGLGKLIGMRTWGGLVGISGNPRLIDGAYVSVPTFAFYELDGTWGVEGHGVEPDLEVVDDPALMVDGGDPQLDAAIAHMLSEIERNPYQPPKRPAYPDRSGMGITEADK